MVRVEGPWTIVRILDQEVRTSLRGNLRADRPRLGPAVAVGDRVRVEADGQGSWTIAGVEARRNLLARVDPGDPRRRQAIAANLDQIVCFQSFRDPLLGLRALDRLLLLGLAAGVPSQIVVNKLDLLHGPPPAKLLFYERIGHPVLAISVRTGAGLSELRARLGGRVSVLVGPSGSGKSSLLNALVPGLHLRVGAVSESTSKGVHTTVRVEWVDLPSGGALLDTPGLRMIQAWGIDAVRLRALWPEFQGKPACRFDDCQHRSEPGCAIRREVECGALPAFRYDSYLRILGSLEKGPPAWRGR